MAKLTLAPIGSFSQSAINTLNQNMDLVEAAMEKTLSRDGTTPNTMTADLDMNEMDILNVGSLDVATLVVDGVDISAVADDAAAAAASAVAAAASAAAAATDQTEIEAILAGYDALTIGTVTTLAAGAPATVTNVGTVAEVILDFGIPQGEEGAAGAGTGDVIGPASATDNGFAKFDGTTGTLLQDSAAVIAVADGGTGATTAAAARTALGLAIGTNVQAFDATLTSLAAVAGVEGDILYADGVNTWTRLPKGTADQVLTMNAGATAPEWETPATSGLTVGTEQVTTSGTAFDFTSIPATAKRITVMFNDVSLSSSGNFLVQIGDAGGIETTTYVSASVRSASGGNNYQESTAGFVVIGQDNARRFSGTMTLIKMGTGEKWLSNHTGCFDLSDNGVAYGGGSKTLSATLDRVRVTRSGVDTFDSGSVNIAYE